MEDLAAIIMKVMGLAALAGYHGALLEVMAVALTQALMEDLAAVISQIMGLAALAGYHGALLEVMAVALMEVTAMEAHMEVVMEAVRKSDRPRPPQPPIC